MANSKKAVETTPAQSTNNETAPATVQQAPPPPKVYESEKLTELRKQYDEARNKAMGFEVGTKEEEEASLEQFRINGLIKAEIQALKNAEAEAIATEKRNQRLAVIDELLAAYDNRSTDEASEEAYKGVREKLSNLLLGTIAKPAKVAADGTTKVGSGNASEGRKKVVDFYLANRDTMSESDIRKQAEADNLAPKSTIWHAINDFKNAEKEGK